MRVIVVNDKGFTSGGAHKVALQSARGLAGLGIQTTFFGVQGPVEPEYRSQENLSFDLATDDGPDQSLKNLIRTAYDEHHFHRFSNLLKQFDRTDTVIHVHIWAQQLSPSIFLAAKEAGFPVVITPHDYSLACPQGQFYNHPKQQCCTLKPGGLACTLTKCTKSRTILSKWAMEYRWWVQKTKASVPSQVPYFITLSNLSESVLKPFLPPSATYYRVRNPIEVQKANRVAVSQNRAFVMSGRLSAEKNPQLLLAAAQKVGATVRFLGEGDLRPEIEAAQYDKATISGWLTSAELMPELRKARALILASRWYEVSPVATQEALAMGIPVVASDLTATSKELKEGKNGLTFRDRDVADLSEKLSLLMDDNILDEMGAFAYQDYWSNPPTEASHLKELVTVYEDILRRHNA